MLRSHSAIRLEAVRASFEGGACVMAGHGMPSETLGSGISWRHSLKLDALETSMENKKTYLALVRGLLI